MALRTEAAIAARELRAACVHEAGHAVVARCFGGVGDARVWKNASDETCAGEKAWCGQFVLFADPGSVKFQRGLKARLGIVRAPKDWSVLVGLAGLIAESIADGLADAEEVYARIDDLFFLDEVSATDAALIGKAYRLHQVRRTLQLLVKRWTDVCALANDLELRAKQAD